MSVKSLPLHKAIWTQPIPKFQFEVTISTDYTGLLSSLVDHVSHPQGDKAVNQAKLGDRIIPYFDGKSEEPYTFQLSFRETPRADVTSFFEANDRAIYTDDGRIDLQALSERSPTIRIHIQDALYRNIITYTYYNCIFIENTVTDHSHDNMEYLTLDFDVFSPKRRRSTSKFGFFELDLPTTIGKSKEAIDGLISSLL